jgi:hypothetical protein
MNYERLIAEARAELALEERREAINREKARLRHPKPSLWQRLVSKLPFTINWKGQS